MKAGKFACFALLAGAAAVIALVGCGAQEGNEGAAVADKDVRTVMEAHVGELMGIDGVAAVAVGALEDGTPCIKVYLAEDSDDARKAIPKELEGHPVVVEVSGKFSPLEDG